MYSEFPLFQSHLDLAHGYWKSSVKPGDIVIDATCGNGQDTLLLCQLALIQDAGHIYAIDIQKTALENTCTRLRENLDGGLIDRVLFIEGCHSKLPGEIKTGSVKLIVYNLGYLPGGNKSLTTQSQTTLDSLESAQSLLQDGGLISVTCYPGHAEGKKEEEMLLEYTSRLDPRTWNVCHSKWLNRNKAPSLLLIQKGRKSPPPL